MRDCYELSTNAYFFYLEQEQKSWMSGRVLFDAPVDVPLLQRAADELFRAMPFLSVRKEVPPEGDRYVLVPCSLPFRVTDRSEKTSPESRESGGALISVSCEGSALYLEMSHALTDGCGFVAVMRYLVIRYLSLLWDDQPEPAGSFSQSFPYDYADPLDSVPETADRFEFACPRVQVFEEGELDPGNLRSFSLACDEKAVTDLARDAEGSFSGVLAGALGSALTACKSGTEPVVVTCPMNMRGALGCRQTLQNCTQSMRYVFPAAMEKYTFQQRLSLLKGQLYIQRSEEYCLPRFAEWRAQLQALRSIPTISGKAEALRASIQLSPFPIVSDLGTVDFGKGNPHVRNIRIAYPVAGSAGILLVAHRFEGRCRLDISSAVRSGLWLDHFRRILAGAGVENELIETP